MQHEIVGVLVAELQQQLERDPTFDEVVKAAEDRRMELPAGIDDARLHDLRRTVGSWLAQSGSSLHLIGKVLDHSSASTTAVYARFGQDSVSQALEEHGQQIVNAAKSEKAEVISIDKARA